MINQVGMIGAILLEIDEQGMELVRSEHLGAITECVNLLIEKFAAIDARENEAVNDG
jgi:hypothetical protein